MENKKNELIEWLKVIVVTALFVITVRAFIFAPIIVDGASMLPTYEDRDRVIVNKIGKTLNDFEHFDIIVFEATETENYIKRIIGLPGDHIAFKNDELYINGEKYDEPYLDLYKSQLHGNESFNYDFTLEELTSLSEIPDGYFFVLGDNRPKSVDSRYPSVGLVSSEQILGKAHLRFYPLDNIGIVK